MDTSAKICRHFYSFIAFRHTDTPILTDIAKVPIVRLVCQLKNSCRAKTNVKMDKVGRQQPQIYITDNMPVSCRVERINDQEISFDIRLNTDDGMPPDIFTSDVTLDFGEEGVIVFPVIYQTTIEF